MFPAERRQQEEIYHLFLVLREFAFGQKEITLCYMASAAANADMATEKQLSPVEKLEKQDKRNFFLSDTNIKREFARVNSFMD